MLFDWKTDDRPSVENYTNGLFTSHFKMPVSPAAFNMLSPVCKPESLYLSGDCIIVSKISSFLLSFSSTAGGLCSLVPFLLFCFGTVCKTYYGRTSQSLSSAGKTEAHTIVWVANLMEILCCLDLALPALGLEISVDAAEKRTRTTTPISQVRMPTGR